MFERGPQEQPVEIFASDAGAVSTSTQGGVRRHVVDLDDRLLAAAQARLGAATIRETISRAVEAQLPNLVERLREAGVTCKPTGRRRPRNIDDQAWAAPAEAEGEVALDLIALLRACLVVAGREPAGRE